MNPHPLDSREVLTLKEAAALLKVTSETLRLNCRRRRVPHGRVGSQYRFHGPTLKAFLAGDGAHL